MRALALAALLLLPGCAITHSGGDWGVYPGLAPGDEVQTIDVTIVGISIDATRDSLDVGYKKLRMSRVPAFDKPALVPSVSATTSTSTSAAGGVSITDDLKVGE